MIKLERDIDLLGGIASKRELVARDNHAESIDVVAWYGRTVILVRKGWYARAGTAPEVLSAWALGGRLACVSALAFRGIVAPEELDAATLHVALARNAQRPKRLPDNTILHWTDSVPFGHLPGAGRSAVPIQGAMRQAMTCPGVSARVRLAAMNAVAAAG
jgi:hypothetical protein